MCVFQKTPFPIFRPTHHFSSVSYLPLPHPRAIPDLKFKRAQLSSTLDSQPHHQLFQIAPRHGIRIDVFHLEHESVIYIVPEELFVYGIEGDGEFGVGAGQLDLALDVGGGVEDQGADFGFVAQEGGVAPEEGEVCVWDCLLVTEAEVEDAKEGDC